MSSKKIAKRNDLLRRSIPNIFHPNLLVLTRGVADLGQEEVKEILKIVKEFNVFTKDNDPWKEHDFGVFDYQGKKIFWKIDDYAGNEGYELVLTILLAEEY